MKLINTLLTGALLGVAPHAELAPVPRTNRGYRGFDDPLIVRQQQARARGHVTYS